MTNRWGNNGNSDRLFSWAPESLWMVTATMKLKTLAHWKKRYCKPRRHFLKRRDIILPTKVHIVRAMVFPVVTYGSERWTIKKSEKQRTNAFELCCWRRLLRVPWAARKSNQSILKNISPEYSLEGSSNTLAT